MSTNTKILIGVAVFVGAGFFWLANEEAKRQAVVDEHKRQENAEFVSNTLKKIEYEECLQKAENDYSFMWDQTCTEVLKKDVDCLLPMFRKEQFDKTLEENKDRCLSVYTAN